MRRRGRQELELGAGNGGGGGSGGGGGGREAGVGLEGAGGADVVDGDGEAAEGAGDEEAAVAVVGVLLGAEEADAGVGCSGEEVLDAALVEGLGFDEVVVELAVSVVALAGLGAAAEGVAEEEVANRGGGDGALEGLAGEVRGEAAYRLAADVDERFDFVLLEKGEELL